ncbi:hypothetical protein HID58_075072 [Brassica napus]|uniref:Uncharacterized protein n=1 Tax=Brassica napus TaxID=3708 RepID=A0ABQ7YLS5_BRANA|nr:hypothetical protein HID58_075072 [Brassica napus]
MGSLSRVKSAHMADLKGKGILYEDDDEPIRLTDQDGSQVIKEFRMSLIGKGIVLPSTLIVLNLLWTGGGVFARVQLPGEQYGRQPLLSDQHKREVESSHQSRQKDDRTKEVTSRWSEARRNHDYKVRHYDENTYQGGSRYGGSRYGGKPYDRHVDQTWCEKKVVKDSVMEKRVDDPLRCSSQSHDVVPYEHTSDKNLTPSREELTQWTVEQASGGNQGVKRLASAIVTPSHDPLRMVDNVTIRDRSVVFSLTFSPNVPAVEAENDQMIGALNDMELLDTGDGGMMDCDGQDDDLLYDDLMDIEEQARSSSLADVSTAHKAHKGIKGARSAIRTHKID